MIIQTEHFSKTEHFSTPMEALPLAQARHF